MSICLLHVSPPSTNGLSACWTFWIFFFRRLLLVSRCASCIPFVREFWMSCELMSLIGISIWPDGNKPSTIVYSPFCFSLCQYHRLRRQSFSSKLVGLQEIANFYLQRTPYCFLIVESLHRFFQSRLLGLPIMRKSCVLFTPVPGFQPYRAWH